jgi:hypothetical protein
MQEFQVYATIRVQIESKRGVVRHETSDGPGGEADEPQETRRARGLPVVLRHTMLWRFGVSHTKCGVHP